MHSLVVLSLFACLLLGAKGGPTLGVQVKSDGSYSINVNSLPWLSSSYYKLYSNGVWYSTSDNSLIQSSSSSTTGSDVLGQYQQNSFIWTTKSNATIKFVTSIKTYSNLPNIVVFSQNFPDGVASTSIDNENTPVTVFPSFSVSNPKLGFLHYNQDMAGSAFQVGMFPTGYSSGYAGGPLALFDSSLSSLILSPLSLFLSTITNFNTSDNVLMAGVQGKVKTIPAGYSFDYLLSLGSSPGISNAFMSWGDVLLTQYGKSRLPPTISTVIQYLGYSTTGFYFYNPLSGNESYGNYEDTMLQFNDYSKNLGIPYRYYLLDSWWYGEYDIYGGVWMWEDNHELLKERFPHGLEWLHDTLGLPFACHMGKWVSNSPYIKNESYGFVTEQKWAVPTSVEFWDYIFQNASGWGLNTIKQDHINEQLMDMEATLSDVTTARLWLLNEGKGAYHHGINIEYCMDYTSVLLTSLENPTATHSRAGGDYVPAQADYQWQIGVTSIFLWAIGLYPDKDTFYTTTNEVTVNPNAPFYNFKEPFPVTHAITSVLSAGPITPSDGIGGTDKTLVMRMCAADGLLLKPDRPAVNIDSTFIQRSFGGAGPQGNVITTYTQIGFSFWHYIFGCQLTTSYNFLTTDLLAPFSGKYVAFLYNSTVDTDINLVPFGEGSPLPIPAGSSYGDAYYWIAAPVLDNGWIFLGETNKYLTVSKQRFKNIITSSTQLQVLVSGTPGEVVTLSVVAPSQSVQQFQCTISNSGFSLFTAPGGSCVMA